MHWKQEAKWGSSSQWGSSLFLFWIRRSAVLLSFLGILSLGTPIWMPQRAKYGYRVKVIGSLRSHLDFQLFSAFRDFSWNSNQTLKIYQRDCRGGIQRSWGTDGWPIKGDSTNRPILVICMVMGSCLAFWKTGTGKLLFTDVLCGFLVWKNFGEFPARFLWPW